MALSNCAQNSDDPKVELDLPGETYAPLAREADRQGLNVKDFLKGVLAKEARRLEYVERSRPKVIEGELAPMRSRAKRAKEVGKTLREIYQRLYVAQGGLWTPAQQTQADEVEAAIRVNDLERLEQILAERPWQKRWPEVRE